MRYLVTGGAGFVGSHLCELLVSEGHEVVVLDDLSTGRERNLEGCRVRLVKGSILENTILEPLVEKADCIVHLAAAVGVRLIVEKPLESLLTNVRGTELVLECCQKFGKRVLIASSSEIYGKNDAIPLAESAERVLGNTNIMRWSYACAKAVDEYLALSYAKKGLKITIFRLFNTVGPRQSSQYGMVIPRFVKQAMRGEPITVYGDGKQVRCFGYVKDVVVAIASLSRCDTAIGETVNLGTDEQVTILRLAELVKEVTKSSSKITFVPYEDVYGKDFEDISKRVPEVSKAEHLISWRATTSLRSILETVAAWESR